MKKIKIESNLCEFIEGEEPPLIKYKKCIECKESKPLYEYTYRNFTARGKEETINTCKKCKRIENKLIAKLRKENPLKNPDMHICPGCNLTEKEIKNRGGWESHIASKVRTIWRLDHCHITKKFRAYLCDYCNNSLGRSLDNPNTLRRLADYAEYHSGKNSP